MTNLIENNIYDKSLLNLYLAGFYHILMQYLNLFPVRMPHFLLQLLSFPHPYIFPP